MPSTATRYRSRRASVSSRLPSANNKLDLSFFDRRPLLGAIPPATFIVARDVILFVLGRAPLALLRSPTFFFLLLAVLLLRGPTFLFERALRRS